MTPARHRSTLPAVPTNRRSSIGFLSLALISLALAVGLAACGGGGGDDNEDPSGNGGTPIATFPPAATAGTGTPEVEADGDAGFRRFAVALDRAFAGRDLTFLQDRMRTIPCPGTEPTPEGETTEPADPGCQPQTAAYQGFPIVVWQFGRSVIPVADVVDEFGRAFAAFEPRESDELGDGSVRLYALNVEPAAYEAIMTTIIIRPADVEGEGALRVAFGTSWEFEGGRWQMTELLLDLRASEDLLAPTDAGRERYPAWERYEGP